MEEQSLVHEGDCVHTLPRVTFKCAISSQQHFKHCNTTNLMQTSFRWKACDQTLQTKQIKNPKKTVHFISYLQISSMTVDTKHLCVDQINTCLCDSPHTQDEAKTPSNFNTYLHHRNSAISDSSPIYWSNNYACSNKWAHLIYYTVNSIQHDNHWP